ncbi:type II toxin-antitoxin system RelE/ParE family toxin [Calycomorphotria hydatis]|uniref:Plasmid stabilization system protein n=1 Tax=Calycomorphotria hydatis TaxID=2528027 RepID=A0A517T6S5_9PLAN|nr:type II toxin-antitoxin system RelE/ParE family toxin [Calycomorphotria hydatis]QDT64076.1 Plasmid stabilization system protein [Calycomorphotria hydatis]
MSYRVVFTPRAERELDQATDWWSENRDHFQAANWYIGFSDKIYGLADNPLLWPVADENDLVDFEVRQLNYGLSSHPTHRALFTVIEPDVVLVLTIRHLAQHRLTADDLDVTPN